jgi:thymidylate kinase
MRASARSPEPANGSPVVRGGSLVRRLFDHLDGHGVVYCVLRGLDEVEPGPAGYELDLLVELEGFERLRHLAERGGFARMPSRGHAPHSFFVGYDQCLRTWIKLDVVTELRYGHPVRALSFGEADGPLARRTSGSEIPTLSRTDEIAHLVLHGLLDKKAFPERYRRRLQTLQDEVRLHRHELEVLHRDFENWFGTALPWRLVAEACVNDHWPALYAQRRALERHAQRRDRVGTWRRRLSGRLARWAARPLGARLGRGLLVAVLGPDGAGKTSLAQSLARSAPFTIRRIYMGHGAAEAARAPWIIRWLSHLAREVPPGTARRRSVFDRSRRWSARLTLQCLKSLEVRVRRSVGQLVVLDRHAFDLAVHARAASAARSWISRLMLKLCPPPDLVVLLDAPPEVLHQRKADEHSLDDLAAQRSAYVDFCRQLPHGIVVDSARSLAEVQADVVGQVWSKYLSASEEAAQ